MNRIASFVIGAAIGALATALVIKLIERDRESLQSLESDIERQLELLERDAVPARA